MRRSANPHLYYVLNSLSFGLKQPNSKVKKATFSKALNHNVKNFLQSLKFHPTHQEAFQICLKMLHQNALLLNRGNIWNFGSFNASCTLVAFSASARKISLVAVKLKPEFTAHMHIFSLETSYRNFHLSSFIDNNTLHGFTQCYLSFFK